MKSAVYERRRMMVNVFVKTWSLKSSVEVVAEKFHVSEGTLRGDWHRRHKWPKEILDQISDSMLSEFYHVGIHSTLRQIEGELIDNKNPSCRVGLLRAKAEILFKLIEIQKSIAHEEVFLKRIENVEEKLRFFESNGQNDRVR